MSATRYQDLIDFAADRCRPDAAARAEAAVRTSPDARRTVALYKAVHHAVATDDSVAPPPDVVARAKARFNRQRSSVLARALASIDRVIATLVFDSRAQPALAGFRGTDLSVRLSFECDLGDIDLEVSGSGSCERSIIGQIHAHESMTDVRVGLTAPGMTEVIAEVSVDPDGGFELAAFAGVFDLSILVGESLITVPSLEIE